MEAILYAEIYLFCIIIVWLCKYWSDQRSSNSASERWLHVALVGFLISFVSNALFTLFNFIVVARQHYGGIYQPAGVFPHRNCMGMAMLLFGPLFYAYYLTRRLKTKTDKFCAAVFPIAAVAT